jgi:hypothetical protein
MRPLLNLRLPAWGKAKPAEVMGHRLPRPAPTFGAAWLVFLYLVAPALVIGGIADLIAQFGFGACTGVWCAAGGQ